MKEMFEASVDGEPYDPERWGAYYRPQGVQAPSGNSTQPPSSNASTGASNATEPENPAPAADPAPAEADVEPKADTGTQKAEDILAMIRSRQSS